MVINYNRRWQEAISRGDKLWLVVSAKGDFHEFYIKSKEGVAECQPLIDTHDH